MASSEPSKSIVSVSSVKVSATFTKAGDLKKGSYVLLTGFPCTIMDIFFAKTGKHGSAKARIVGLDVLTRRKYTWVGPSTAAMETFKLDKREYTVIGVTLTQNDEIATADYIDEENVCQRIDLHSDMAKKLQSLLNTDTNNVFIKVVRAPCRNFNGVYSNDDTTTVQIVESFHTQN